MFRHYLVILRELVINTLSSYTSISNAAVGNTIYNYSVETCSSVIICEIIVHLLVIVQNNKGCMVHSVKIMEAQQAKIYNNYKNTRLKLLKTNAAILLKKM
jgi:hypothetical protein